MKIPKSLQGLALAAAPLSLVAIVTGCVVPNSGPFMDISGRNPSADAPQLFFRHEKPSFCSGPLELNVSYGHQGEVRVNQDTLVLVINDWNGNRVHAFSDVYLIPGSSYNGTKVLPPHRTENLGPGDYTMKALVFSVWTDSNKSPEARGKAGFTVSEC